MPGSEIVDNNFAVFICPVMVDGENPARIVRKYLALVGKALHARGIGFSIPGRIQNTGISFSLSH